MSTTKNDRAVSDFELERLLRGELGEAEAASVHARLAARGEEGRLEALRRSDEEILAKHAPADVAREVRRRHVMAEAASPRRRRAPWAMSLLGTVAAVSAIWLVARPAVGPTVPTRPTASQNVLPPEHIIVRGEPALHIFRQTSGEPQRLDAKTRVRPGDNIQLRYIAEGDRFGFIASVDARGTVNLHLPENGGPAADLQPSGERALPHSYELDSTPGFERFVFVSSPSSFDTRPYAEALASGKPLPQSPRVHVTELTLLKDTP